MVSFYQLALKEYNKGQPSYCNPRKGTADYLAVKQYADELKIAKNLKKKTPAEQALDKAYEILGLEPKRSTLTLDDLKKTYKMLALKNHPDKNPAEEAPIWNKKFIKINDAFELIKKFAFPEAAGFYGGKLPKKLTLVQAKALFKRTFPDVKI